MKADNLTIYLHYTHFPLSLTLVQRINQLMDQIVRISKSHNCQLQGSCCDENLNLSLVWDFDGSTQLRDRRGWSISTPFLSSVHLHCSYRALMRKNSLHFYEGRHSAKPQRFSRMLLNTWAFWCQGSLSHGWFNM